MNHADIKADVVYGARRRSRRGLSACPRWASSYAMTGDRAGWVAGDYRKGPAPTASIDWRLTMGTRQASAKIFASLSAHNTEQDVADEEAWDHLLARVETLLQDPRYADINAHLA